MKISICIPVYNFDVRDLVNSLLQEIDDNQLDAEVILIDDASDEFFKKINFELKSKVKHFIFLDKNVGRSVIRNTFLYYAKGNYLLFLDCDGKIISKNFLKNYIDFIEKNQKIKAVYGGRKVSETIPENERLLRWKFSVERENKPVFQRKQNPYLNFQSNNFIIKRNVFEKNLFNPEFQKYGYEDLLFAMDLKFSKIPVDHIENPILNNDLESNSVYLKKVEEAVESLCKMLNNSKTAEKISEIKLIKAYRYLEKSGMKTWFSKLFNLRKEATKEKLLTGNANLRYLDFYKLGLLIEKMSKIE